MSTIDEIMEMIYRWEDAADDHLDGALFLTIKSAIDTKDAEIERLRARLAEINALYGVPAITLSTICALPLPAGTVNVVMDREHGGLTFAPAKRQAVLLTDEQIERAVDGHGWTVSELQVEDIPGMARDIEAAVLAANGLGVRRG